MSFFKSFLGKDPSSPLFRKQPRVLLREWNDTIRNHIKDDVATFALDEAQVSYLLSIFGQAAAVHLEQSRGVSPSGEKIYPPVDSTSVFHITDDHMTAYLCLLPPLNNGKDITMERLTEDLYCEGITCGVDQELLARLIADQSYLHIQCIARGTPPQDGQDGAIASPFFACRAISLELADGELPDFHSDYQAKPVRKGDVICQMKLPTKAIEGQQVTGQTLPAQDGVMPPIPAGTNTVVADDQQSIFAAVDGVVFLDQGNLVVQLQYLVMGNADSTTGNIRCQEDLYIKGNVKDGVTVQSDGNIIVEGTVTSGHLIAGGSIRVQQGATSMEGEVTLKAGRQIQCAAIKNATAEATGNIYAEIILNSTVTSTQGGIYALIGRGAIIGGHMLARKSIYAKKIGNQAAVSNKITVGYAPELTTKINAAKGELTQTKTVLEKLRGSISLLHMAGSQLSPEKRGILKQLVEQRTLYEQKEQEQNQQIQKLTQELYSRNQESVVCDEMFPGTEIFIGTQSKAVQNHMSGCHVQIQSGKIMFA